MFLKQTSSKKYFVLPQLISKCDTSWIVNTDLKIHTPVQVQKTQTYSTPVISVISLLFTAVSWTSIGTSLIALSPWIWGSPRKDQSAQTYLSASMRGNHSSTFASFRFILCHLLPCYYNYWSSFILYAYLSGITVLLSLTVFMLLVAEIMPATSDSVPLIGKLTTVFIHFYFLLNEKQWPCMTASSKANYMYN